MRMKGNMGKIKTLLRVLAISAAALSAAAKAPNRVLDGFSETGKFAKIDLAAASISEDMKSAQISAPENRGKKIILSTKPGLLKAGGKYVAKLKYALSSPDPSALAHIRLFAPGAQRHLGASAGESFAKMPFEVGAEDANAAVSIEISGPLEASISGFSIEEGDGETFISARGNGPKFEGDLGGLPTGAPEFSIDLPAPKNGATVNAADYGMAEGNEDCASALNRAIAACKEKNASKLVIPKGTYKFFSNSTVNIDGFTDFTVDGQGSLFVYRRDRGGANISVMNCLRTKICNFSMDWDWDTEPLAAIVKAVEVKRDGKESYADFEIVDYEKYPLYGKNVRVANLQPWDAAAGEIGVEGMNGIGFGFSPVDKGPRIEWLAPNKIRIFSGHCAYIAKDNIGKFYRMQHYYYGMGGMALVNNRHFTMENVNIHSCKGHGLLCSGGQQYWQLINVNIVPRAGFPKNVITTTADHLHFARSKGYFKMLGCEFSLGSDDCINIHDTTSFGVKIGRKSLLIKTRSAALEPGNVVELRHGDYSPSGFKSEIERVERKDGKTIAHFKKAIPEQKFDGFVLFNRVYDSKNTLISGCKFHGNRARGLLILSSNVTIENTRFSHIEMGGIKLETGYTFNLWSEGYGVNNVVVRNCEFDSVNVCDRKYQGKARDIFIGAYLRRDPSFEQTRYPIISNVLFENNTFKNSFGLIALISSSGNVTFKDNTFENTVKRMSPNAYRAAFYVNNSQNARIINNTWIDSPLVPNPGVYYDADTVEGLVVKGNRVAEKP